MRKLLLIALMVPGVCLAQTVTSFIQQKITEDQNIITSLQNKMKRQDARINNMISQKQSEIITLRTELSKAQVMDNSAS